MPGTFADEQMATVAAYYLAGIEVGVLAGDSAKEWAFGIVDVMDDPPIAIIELATANDRLAAIAALGAVDGSPDHGRAGRRLLSDLAAQLEAGLIRPMPCVHAVRRVCKVLGLKDLEHEFMEFEESLQLALDGIFGSPEVLRLELIELLKQGGRANA